MKKSISKIFGRQGKKEKKKRSQSLPLSKKSSDDCDEPESIVESLQESVVRASEGVPWSKSGASTISTRGSSHGFRSSEPVDPIATSPITTSTTNSMAENQHRSNSSSSHNENDSGRKDSLLGATVGRASVPAPSSTTTATTMSVSYQQQQQSPQYDMSMSGFVEEPTDPPHLMKSYDEITVLEQMKLPRGGVSVETSAVGRIQFGIPPETIKDSMRLGLPVPQVYIVPVERFCREIGPALGVNLAEFEFPAYFNFFVYKKRCTLVVDSTDAEDNIRRVFSETLLGPAQFRRDGDPISFEPEDFAPSFPREAIPNFQKELQHFRIMPDGKELVIETLLDFRHFEMRSNGHLNLGVPRPLEDSADDKGTENSETADEKAVEAMYGGENSCDEDDVAEEDVPSDEIGVERREKKNPWTYSQARFMGDVATVWPSTATEEQKEKRNVPHVEIFKMPGGTEYIIHDVDENNYIVGKARISGHLKVSESMSVDGFGGHSIMDDVKAVQKRPTPPAVDSKQDLTHDSESSRLVDELFSQMIAPPTFHPPSFGVTVLGNSHGFDKSGSTSGYVLWVNGRGVMIDPPPYSSATLEREGIRPRTIVGIILTHCHADHDAGAFQKVLTGSPVVVITTPTIYKSFIRKYAALSNLSPALLRHSHRFKPAIIGQPLRFQGATFHFTYTLHTIPCVGFRVEWRGRSMVFTGDHFNSPTGMDSLEASGVLSKARADDLRNLPLQDTDLLLHEAGAPPIHTPLEVLLQLPMEVKKRLYVVHTSALPADCELKAAPTGTKGTIRLDQNDAPMNESLRSMGSKSERAMSYVGDDEYDSIWIAGRNEYETITEETSSSNAARRNVNIHSSFANLEVQQSASAKAARTSMYAGNHHRPSLNDAPPLVALRPASSTDAWFILNLLSAVPFLSSLSYTSTMELLETARVDAYKKYDIILPASRRSTLLCVVWEGTCSEAPSSVRSTSISMSASYPLRTVEEVPSHQATAVWHAGDWTGPISLQPDQHLSGESPTSSSHDVVAVSTEGVKVITVEFAGLHSILKSGSSLYRKYLERKSYQERAKLDTSTSDQHSSTTEKLLDDALKDLNVLDLLNCNSALRKLNAVQKRHLESLAEGPISFQPGKRIWTAGCPVDKAFLIVSGSASFVPKRRNAGSAIMSSSRDNTDSDKHSEGNVGAEMQIDAMKAVKELGKGLNGPGDGDNTSLSSAEQEEQMKSPSMSLERVFLKSGNSDPNNPDFEKLRQGLERRANHISTESASVASGDFSMGDSHEHDTDTDNESQIDYTFTDDADPGKRSGRNSVLRRRSSRARKANKVLGRLYNRRAFTGGLVFSRGHFLGDVSKMVQGLLASDLIGDATDEGPAYGFGDQVEGAEDTTIGELTIPEEGAQQITHNSTLTAGKDGCVVLVFRKSSILPFLDQYPGLLLSLLGTQVVV